MMVSPFLIVIQKLLGSHYSEPFIDCVSESFDKEEMSNSIQFFIHTT